MRQSDGSRPSVREDLRDAQARAWQRIGRAGTWLDARQRLAVAREVRQARECAHCRRIKSALSPYAVDGHHDTSTDLPEAWIEMVHRIVADPARLTRGWSERVRRDGISDEEYIEVLGVVASVVAVDTFDRAIGQSPRPLPKAEPGTPSRYRPKEARRHAAWLPHIAWDEHGPNEADYFHGNAANIRMALTLVPDEARSFFDLAAHQYLPGNAMRDFTREYRAITHAQIELIAGRVSAMNQCEY